ncbi:MAG: ribosome biosis GTPase Der [Pseudomonadota bacterium]|jgi:GTP-binding protein
MKPTIALVGRPNVGKSTLFNRLTRSRDALVADFAGLTRDRHYGIGRVGHKPYILVDTGGFEPLVDNGVMLEMARQSEQAIDESDIVIFMVDGRNGFTPQDKLIANKLRILDKPVFVAVNKVEGVDKIIAISDFYELGLTKLYPISATHGDGVHKLIDDVLRNCKKAEENETTNPDKITFAVVGRPNVGKSTLVNAILGEDRVIAFDEAGTTRDSIYIDFEANEQQYTIIDTAGIRRKGRVQDKLEKFSVLKSIQAISDANVVVLVLDAHLDIAEQDATIVGYALEAGKSIVVAVNKWDHLDEERRTMIKDDIKTKLHFLDFAKYTYISALYKKGIGELLTSIQAAYTSAFAKLPTPKLTRILKEAINRQPPAHKGNFRPKMRYAHQGGSNPPIIIIHGNSLQAVQGAYTKYLERSFRKVFNLVGTPLRIEYKNSDNPFKD